MNCVSFDLTVEEAVADPVIGAAMRADRVDPRDLEALLRSTARRVAGARLPGSLPAALACRARGVSEGSVRLW